MENDTTLEVTQHHAYITKIEGRVVHVLYHFEKEPENWKDTCTGKTAEMITNDGHKLLLDSVLNMLEKFSQIIVKIIYIKENFLQQMSGTE